MGRAQVGNALEVLGKGLGALAGSRIERESKDIDYMREQSLRELEHGFRTDELIMANDADQKRFEAGQEGEERRNKEAMAHNERLASDRNRRDDIESLRSSHNALTKRIDDRIQDLTDALNKEEYYEGSPGYAAVMQELDQLEGQRDGLDADFMLQMRDLGAPGFGEQINSLLGTNRAGQTAPPPEGEAPEPGAPPAAVGRTDQQIGTDLLAAEASRPGWDPGLTPEERQRLGMPATGTGEAAPASSPRAMALEEPPPPPPPAPSYNSMGRKPARRGGGAALPTSKGRGGVDILDVNAMFRMQPPVERPRAPGRPNAGPVLPSEPDKRDQARDAYANTVLGEIRAGRDVANLKDINRVRSMAPSKLRELGYTDREIVKLLGRGK